MTLLLLFPFVIQGLTKPNGVVGAFFSIMSVLAAGFFTLMVGTLIPFHIYLASVNLTTWEVLSWKNISYMKIWPRKYGSPFFKSYSDSLGVYFFNKTQSHEFIHWEYPTSLPSFEEGASLSRQNLLARCVRKFVRI